MMPDRDDLHGRLIAVETRQADDRRELNRLREKVHELQGALAAITLLNAALERIRDDVAKIGAELPNVARRAAEEAIDVAFERQIGEHRQGLSLRNQIIVTIVGLVTLALLIYDHATL